MDKPMKNIEAFYILGRPIITDIGILYPFKVKEYPDIMEYLECIKLSRGDVILHFKKLARKHPNIGVLVEILRNMKLYDFVMMFSDSKYADTALYQFYKSYKQTFEYCFREDVFDKIQTNDEFEYYMNLIRKFNDIEYEETVPNERIQALNQLKKSDKDANTQTDFEAMYTSIAITTNRDIGEMTLYQFNRIFDRIGQFKNYDASIIHSLFAEEPQITPWYKIFEKQIKEQNFLTEGMLQEAIKNNGLTQKL